jgi:hypothetical protein
MYPEGCPDLTFTLRKLTTSPRQLLSLFRIARDAYAAHCTLLRLRRILSPIFAFQLELLRLALPSPRIRLRVPLIGAVRMSPAPAAEPPLFKATSIRLRPRESRFSQVSNRPMAPVVSESLGGSGVWNGQGGVAMQPSQSGNATPLCRICVLLGCAALLQLPAGRGSRPSELSGRDTSFCKMHLRSHDRPTGAFRLRTECGTNARRETSGRTICHPADRLLLLRSRACRMIEAR